MINTFLKIYFTIGIVIFIFNIVSIYIIIIASYINQHSWDYEFVRYVKFKTIKEAFSGLISCILFSFILWPVSVIVSIVVLINFFNKRR